MILTYERDDSVDFLEKQINEAKENYNYFCIKLIICIMKNIFKLSIILLLSSIFNYFIINVIAIICTVYYFFILFDIIKYYSNIIKDIKDTVGYEELCFEINFDLLNKDIFRGKIKYGR